ncbi:NAD(P)-dependent alcohol dehydrogenase [Pollutibacter soli]|uniref:NAD(P)-dependent alcohol dehydrogenase n=1 Tax=Pollutibacter soli TaxID=3034157 RepID=UPI003013DFFF
MKAIVYTAYGNTDVLELKEISKPVPADDEVLVKVHAVSINDWDIALMNGDFVNRMLNGFAKPKRTILGSDIAGVVEACGKKVSKFKIGDEVYGDLSGRWGGFAEWVCAQEKMLEHKPPVMSFVDAAAIPQAAMLAVQGLIDVGRIKSGQKVLINGAGGGVGTFGVQLAKQFDVEITGVDLGSKLEMLSKIGFDYVLDYTKTDFTNTGQQYDLILDVKTNRPVFDYARALNSGGTYATVGGSISRLLQTLIVGGAIRLFSGKRMSIVSLKPNKDLAYCNELYTAGKFKPIIDGPFQLEDFQSAIGLFVRGEHKGKVVITI